jgi:hypothetical protein
MRRKQRLPLPFPTPHVFASQKHPRHTQQTLQHVLHTATQTTTGTKADIGCPGAPLFVSVSVHSASLKEELLVACSQPHAQPDHDSTYSPISSRTVYHNHHHHYTTQPACVPANAWRIRVPLFQACLGGWWRSYSPPLPASCLGETTSKPPLSSPWVPVPLR